MNTKVADVRFFNIVVEVDVAGENYPLELKDREFQCEGWEYNSPEEFEELLEDLIDQLTDELGYCILSCEYDWNDKTQGE